jgi:hypothetical protein
MRIKEFGNAEDMIPGYSSSEESEEDPMLNPDKINLQIKGGLSANVLLDGDDEDNDESIGGVKKDKKKKPIVSKKVVNVASQDGVVIDLNHIIEVKCDGM